VKWVIDLVFHGKKGVLTAFEDETWLELNPTIAATWMPRGVQLEIPTPGVNRRINIKSGTSLNFGTRHARLIISQTRNHYQKPGFSYPHFTMF